MPVRFDPAGEFCLSDQGRRDMLINLEMYRAAVERGNATIRAWNATVKP